MHKVLYKAPASQKVVHKSYPHKAIFDNLKTVQNDNFQNYIVDNLGVLVDKWITFVQKCVFIHKKW